LCETTKNQKEKSQSQGTKSDKKRKSATMSDSSDGEFQSPKKRKLDHSKVNEQDRWQTRALSQKLIEVMSSNIRNDRHINSSPPTPNPLNTFTQGDSQHSSPTPFSEFYRHYESIQEKTLKKVVEQDKKHYISGALSASISKEYFTNRFRNDESALQHSHSLIQLVKTSEVLDFIEFDRTTEPKSNTNDPMEEIEQTCGSIGTSGLQEPLLLSYCHSKKKAILSEGNHRIQWFHKNNVEYVPLKVISYQGNTLSFNYHNSSSCEEESDDMEVDSNSHEYNWPSVYARPSVFSQYIVASDLGFSVYQKEKNKHPYFPAELEYAISVDVDPVSWSDQNIYQKENEMMLCYDDLISH
jgi:hypothetical protein